MFEDALALLIGISEYENQESFPPELERIDCSHADARLMQESLLCLGFQKPNILCLCNSGATKKNIHAALQEIWDKTKRSTDQLILFFFAGHGWEESRFNISTPYLLPYDAIVSLLVDRVIEVRWLAEVLSQFTASRKVIFLDACRSGGFRPELMYQQFVSHNTALIAACGANQVSLELVNEKHGLFTLRLVEALCGLGEKNSDGTVTVNQVSNYLQRTVPKDAKKFPDYEGKPYDQRPYCQILSHELWAIGRDISKAVEKKLEDENLPLIVRHRAKKAQEAR